MQINEPLVFEHKLREHVRAQTLRCDEFDTRENAHSSSLDWEFTYKHADGGLWHVTPPWRYKLHASFQAAQLCDAVTNAFNAIRAQQATKTLPTQLTYSGFAQSE
jgi:hypothetical protein